MLQPRIIACLLVKGPGLVKTIGFKAPTYVGDPINVVRIFNEKEVDELIVLDIDASVQRREPNYRLIEAIAAECTMPLCYGGGVKTVTQINRIISLGVEKVALGSAAVEAPDLIDAAAKVVGNQSVVGVVDVRKHGREYHAFINNGRDRVATSPRELIRELASRGAGEIVVNSIDRDGTRTGYDYELVEMALAQVSVPLTVLGGAGKLDDLRALFEGFGLIGAAAGTLFTFKGQYRAVLVNYPTAAEKQALLKGWSPAIAPAARIRMR